MNGNLYNLSNRVNTKTNDLDYNLIDWLEGSLDVANCQFYENNKPTDYSRRRGIYF